ncbi:hypothetical protein [Pseudobacteroides cellulosolvens]|uniref:hypothetical protein n=1 Tax=Pseudobacteroides cellulosolvens TaxID=35825 RepID=UPI001364BB48|nr:hypothetical protein [Pseudobacteroides cellulosolvens]
MFDIKNSALKIKYNAKSIVKTGTGDCFTQLLLFMRMPLNVENVTIQIYMIEKE